MSHSANPQMSPERSPGSIAPGAGVRRANKLPLYLGIGLIAVVALVVSSRVELIETQRARSPLPTAAPPMQS